MTVLQAPVGLMAGRRRPLRPWHLKVRIEDLLMVTWELPVEVVRKALPPRLTPWSRDGMARTSALVFQNRDQRPALTGFPRLASRQLNLRTYVLDPATGVAGSVFFHALRLDPGWLATLSRVALGAPIAALRFGIESRRAGGRLDSWKAESADGSLRIRAEPDDTGATLPEADLDLLTNPHTGFFLDSRTGALQGFSIWHPPQELRVMRVTAASLALLARYGLGGGHTLPALHVDQVDYEVYLPPRRVPVGDGHSSTPPP